VGEALVAAGVAQEDVAFIGGDRLEARVFPEAGFPFLQIEVQGLQRGEILANLRIPAILVRARRRAIQIVRERKVDAVLGFGNYITVPVAMAARRLAVPLFIHEQNAHAGLANRMVSRWARESFVSFPNTAGLTRPTYTGNPLRAIFTGFDRDGLRSGAQTHFGLVPDRVTIGVYGGSLGAKAINDAVVRMVAEWEGPEIQLVHLVGRNGAELIDAQLKQGERVGVWNRRSFEDRMDLFFAASDLVIARASGSIAEMLATATPSILVPGGFGSSGHQAANAEFAARTGAARVLPEAQLGTLGAVVEALVGEPGRLAAMAAAARSHARPDAAETIAHRLLEAADEH
jgi:UDP-N-acetylglucosamine--N-acetylmuramyl-(pentapeptide) pyrophosphoryl-undecaprenol N-acetylglucosamine transferase